MPDEPLHVLVIEDDPDDARLLREALGDAEPQAFAMAWANRLQEGLEHLRANHVDALLLDLGLPDSQGMDTFEAIQKQAPQIPIVVLSGLADEDLAMQGYSRARRTTSSRDR